MLIVEVQQSVLVLVPCVTRSLHAHLNVCLKPLSWLCFFGEIPWHVSPPPTPPFPHPPTPPSHLPHTSLSRLPHSSHTFPHSSSHPHTPPSQKQCSVRMKMAPSLLSPCPPPAQTRSFTSFPCPTQCWT